MQQLFFIRMRKLQFIAQLTLCNAECRMQNDCVGFADGFKLFPEEIPQLRILHS